MLRRRMMMAQGGVSLPAGYTKIEYLESDGNSYIDTGFKPNQDTRVVMDVDIKSQSSYPKVLFGARNGSTTSNASFIVWAITKDGFRTDFGSESLVTTVIPTGRFVIDKNKDVTSFNGIEYTNPAYTFQSNYNIGLFTQIDVDGPDDRASTAKLYSCQIYDNGTLVRDFIPAMNASGEAGLYDLKNDVWYALLPVVKPKVENKISAVISDCDFIEIKDPLTGGFTVARRCYMRAQATYAVESDITVKYKYEYEFGGGFVDPTSSVIAKGSRISLTGPAFLIDSSVPHIYSISPTEDDTYIYTF